MNPFAGHPGCQSEDLCGENLNRQPLKPLASRKKIASRTKKKELEDNNTRTLDAMRKNIVQVLEKSTIMPFRWLSSCFRCFYCYEMFDKPQDLKSHQETHNPQDLEKNMRSYCEPLVHVDVSEISCKLCYARMDDVFQLVDHLIILHEIPFDREIGISLVPLNLDEGPKCFFCAMVLKTYALLLAHMNKFHKNYFKSLCAKCGRQFKGYEDLCRHAKSQTLEDYQEKCSQCGLLVSYGVLRAHMKDVHGRRYKCLSCFEFFTSHYKRSNHMADVHNRRDRIKCSYCNKTFIFKSIMQRHVRENHLKVKNAVCEICGWKTFGKHELVNHMARHTSLRVIKCPDFSEPVIRNTSERHRKYDITKLLTVIIECSTIMPFRWCANKFMCFYCGCPFVDSSKLKQHTTEEHSDAKLKNVLRNNRCSRIKLDISDISCKLCPKPVSNVEEFLKHISHAHDVKIDTNDVDEALFSFKLNDECMKCLECGQSFRFFGPLLTHVHRFHTKVKTFLCDICGQGFVAKVNLYSHVRSVHSSYSFKWDDCKNRIRSKEVSVKCPKCSEVFRSSYLRKQHLALVHDVKASQFKCEECPRIFTEKSRLVEHKLRTHLKEKTFACEICGFKVFMRFLYEVLSEEEDLGYP
ncbi:zinc finger protein 879-like [Bicyclus anynana]|uniref:Zinc finger protein 879-like n=1 Tax=Bicyclus anynana TaxID=110368 RepID=A0ABM3M482_BICAN|nr:zinc finger protein 879-like [Bicyclus anynana]